MELAIILLFITGYFAISLEHIINVNKAASALISSILCWVVYISYHTDKEHVTHELMSHMGEISSILFFLLGAMTIVELIDAHNGFQIINDNIKTRSKVKLIWLIGFITFFLSSLLDNLTTTIVIVSILRKLIVEKEDRMLFVGITIIAANAGGAWSPLGDVTTTMLWIGNQITAFTVMYKLFFPSLICLIVSLLYVSFKFKGDIPYENIGSSNSAQDDMAITKSERDLVFWLGLGCLLFVPIFKAVTHLPPYMGMLFCMGFMWIITEYIHKGKNSEDKDFLSVVHALRKIDTPSILFFLGILLSIAALEVSGILITAANQLTTYIGDEKLIVLSIGLLSAIVDNVPLVAAMQGMYTLDVHATDSFFWLFLSYCTGTGGSTLIIGSAAGVAAMGLERISFFWTSNE